MRVDRHTKTKKSIFCSLEIFRVREKDFPVEVVELKGTSHYLFFCLRSIIANINVAQIRSRTFRGSLKASASRSSRAAIRIWAILGRASPSRRT